MVWQVTTFVFYGVMALIVLLPDMLGWVRLLLIGLVSVLMLFRFSVICGSSWGLRKRFPSESGKKETDE